MSERNPTCLPGAIQEKYNYRKAVPRNCSMCKHSNFTYRGEMCIKWDEPHIVGRNDICDLFEEDNEQ